MSKYLRKTHKGKLSSVNNMNNHSVAKVASAHKIAFAIFFIIHVVLEYFIYPKITSNFLKAFVIAVVGAFMYAGIYKIVKYVMNKHIEKKQNQFCIQGVWYHVHIPHRLGEIDYSRKHLSCGESIIRRELYDFALSATNWDYSISNGQVIQSTERETKWHTVISEISDTNESEYDFIQIYNANTNIVANMNITSCPCCKHKFETPIEIEEAGKNRYGIHKFTIDRTKYKPGLGYTRMKAQYLDCWPSLKSGELFLYRDKKERDKKIQEYFEHRYESITVNK